MASIMGLPQHSGAFSTFRFSQPVQQTSNSARTLRPHRVQRKTGKFRASVSSCGLWLKSFPQKMERSRLPQTINAHRAIHGGQEPPAMNASPVPESQPVASPRRRRFAGKLWLFAAIVIILAVSAFATSMMFLLPPSVPAQPLNSTETMTAGIRLMDLF
jgi:hypothetical protein